MQIKIGISARHVHLCEEDLKKLFGPEYKLTFFRPLSQLGEFAANETVTVKTPHGEINKMRILGPTRPYTQVELTQTEAYGLKIKPPVRASGDLEGSAEVTLVGPLGEVTKPCCIIASRHIHLNPSQASEFNVEDKEYVQVEFSGPKKTVFRDVLVRVKDTYVSEMHIDNDDSNGNLLNQGDIGEMKKLDN